MGVSGFWQKRWQYSPMCLLNLQIDNIVPRVLMNSRGCPGPGAPTDSAPMAPYLSAGVQSVDEILEDFLLLFLHSFVRHSCRFDTRRLVYTQTKRNCSNLFFLSAYLPFCRFGIWSQTHLVVPPDTELYVPCTTNKQEAENQSENKTKHRGQETEELLCTSNHWLTCIYGHTCPYIHANCIQV